jgi:hypothetical protein
MNRGDVGMIQGSQQLGFTLETRLNPARLAMPANG